MNPIKLAAAFALLLSFSATSFSVTKSEYEADKNNLDLARQYAAELFAARKFSESLEVIDESRLVPRRSSILSSRSPAALEKKMLDSRVPPAQTSMA